ncbi:unnamed protein product, partial [Symbiodinium sp. KB8]
MPRQIGSPSDAQTLGRCEELAEDPGRGDEEKDSFVPRVRGVGTKERDWPCCSAGFVCSFVMTLVGLCTAILLKSDMLGEWSRDVANAEGSETTSAPLGRALLDGFLHRTDEKEPGIRIMANPKNEIMELVIIYYVFCPCSHAPVIGVVVLQIAITMIIIIIIIIIILNSSISTSISIVIVIVIIVIVIVICVIVIIVIVIIIIIIITIIIIIFVIIISSSIIIIIIISSSILCCHGKRNSWRFLGTALKEEGFLFRV